MNLIKAKSLARAFGTFLGQGRQGRGSIRYNINLRSRNVIHRLRLRSLIRAEKENTFSSSHFLKFASSQRLEVKECVSPFATTTN